MDALILSCGTGGGHNAAGSAVAAELIRRGHHAAMFNPYTLRSERLAERIDSLYIETVQKAPTVFGAVYRAGQLYRDLPGRSPVYFVNRGMVPVMQEYLSRNHVDVIIAPHLFPAEILTGMNGRDSLFQRRFLLPRITPAFPLQKKRMRRIRHSLRRIGRILCELRPSGRKTVPSGIPVSSRFSQKGTREEACERLGLDPGKKYVLAAGGSMGGGKIKKVIQLLSDEIAERQDTELLVLCGSNKQLYKELMEKAFPSVTVMGFTSEIADYMKAACLFVTKPGGLSSTEAAVSGIPIIHVAPIPAAKPTTRAFLTNTA